MASRYDELDASLELEQRLSADLKIALEPRGCEVIHHGTNSGGRHAPGGKPDIEIRDRPNNRLILVEVTKRKGSAADGEFNAIVDHMNRAVDAGGYDDYGMLYISPATSARMSMNLRDLYNRTRERQNLGGRIVPIDFEAAQMMIDLWSHADSRLYPSSRLGELLSRWEEAVDDARTRQLIQATLFPEEYSLADDLAQEAQEFDAERERALKKALEKVENDFRSYGITGSNANITLVYLAFIRLFEERRQRRTAQANRFTLSGFTAWKESMPATHKRLYQNRMVEGLLHEIAEEKDLKEADLLQKISDTPPRFHEKLTDALVEKMILPVFDNYDFHAGRIDVLGAVFETLARRSEKDTRVGQFFTPQQVVDFCADLVELKPTDVVLDPAVGTGRFLIAAMNRMLDNADALPAKNQEDVEASIRQRQMLGADIDGWVSTIAKMNMFIHGDGKSGIAPINGLSLGDTSIFREAKSGLDSAVDVILTNPPLGDTDHTVAADTWRDLHGDQQELAKFYKWLGVVPLEVVEETQLRDLKASREQIDSRIAALEEMDAQDRPKGALTRALRKRDGISERILQLQADIVAGNITRRPRGRSMKGGALFLGAIARYLKAQRVPDELIEWQGGRVALVVDEAILNTPDYRHVRAFIRRNFFVKAVISLSRDAFKYLAHTDAKTSVLYLIKKPRPELLQREPIFYAHAERVGYSAVGKWVGDDLPQTLVYYKVFRRAIRQAYKGHHLNGDEALRVTRNLPGHGSAFFSRPLSDGLRDRLDFFGARLEQRRDELTHKYSQLIKFGDIFDVAPRIAPEASRTGEYEFAVVSRTGVAEYKGRQQVSYAPRDLWVVQKGDLVLSSIDLVHGAVAIAGPEVDGLVMSKEMYAYRLRPGVKASPEYIQILLRAQAAREMLFGFATGTSNRTRLERPEQLLEFPLPPLPSLEEQERQAQALRGAYIMHKEAQRQLDALLETAQTAWGSQSGGENRDTRDLPVTPARELV